MKPPENAVDEGAEEEFDDYEPLTPELVEDEAIRGDFVLKWAVVLLAFLLGSTRIGETATLVHIKSGEYLASHGFLPPAHDVFSYTATARPWTNLSWGFDLLVAGVHAVGAFVGLSIVKALLAAVLFGVIVSISRPGLPTWWGAICGALALLASYNRLTAQPALITLLGIALVLWIIHEWGLPGSRSQRLWLLVPLLFLWSNLDSRAFFGGALLVLYAAGDSLGALFGLSVDRPAGARKQLWMVTGVALAAMMIHPFGYRALLAPWHLYGVEYTALREYISGKYLGASNTPIGPSLLFFPMTTENFWTHLDLAGLSALVVIGLAAIVFVLNAARLELGQLFVFLGFVVFALLCLHELAIASVVACVYAALNGQSWYAATFRQTYSLDTSELVFSRGGRALTVLAFGVIAFFGGTGRLRDVQSPRTGYGIDHNLSVALDDLRQQLGGDRSFDHKPFNMLLTQGDQLIWAGEQVFADSRVGVYYSPDIQQNLLAIQTQTRAALRPQRDRQPGGGGEKKYKPWKAVFDEFGITHVVARLSLSTTTIAGLDYISMLELLMDESHWQLVSLGPSAAVVYRADLEQPELKDFLAAHVVDFRDRAYRQSDWPPIAPREKWIRPPSFYQRYFWSAKQDVPAEVQEAMHLVRIAQLPVLPQALEIDRAAMAYIGVRRAQEGLAKDPDSISGYLALGQGYQLLAEWDASVLRNGYRMPHAGTRYLQAVSAYNQALVGDPDNQTAHFALTSLYQGAQRLDLALRHYDALDRILSSNPDSDPELLLQISNTSGQLRKAVEAVDDQLAQAPEGEAGLQQRLQVALSRGCLLRALSELNQEATRMGGNLPLEQARIQLLIEAGRGEEANSAAEQFAEPARRSGLRDWANTVALANLPDANYARVAELWSESADEMEKAGVNNLLLSVAPRPSNTPWPLGTTQAAFDVFFARPEAVAARKLELALLYLEEGRLHLAEDTFHEVLAANPETPGRRLAAHYIHELTGKDDVDVLPPSERIPILFAPEEGEAEPDEQAPAN